MSAPLHLVGRTFGRLTVLSRCEERSADGSVLWLCACSCGGSRRVRTAALLAPDGGSSRNAVRQCKDCAARSRHADRPTRRADLAGQQFGALTVIEQAPKQGRYVCWLCRCDCGREVVVKAGNLARPGRRSDERSCGECPGQRERQAAEAIAAGATGRRAEVLAAIAAGKTLAQIAEEMGVSKQRISQIAEADAGESCPAAAKADACLHCGGSLPPAALRYCSAACRQKARHARSYRPTGRPKGRPRKEKK